MSKEQHMLPVWFFVGVLLTVYGVIILITSVLPYSHRCYSFRSPGIIAGIWGGILLIIIGGFYTLRFWPRVGGAKGK